MENKLMPVVEESENIPVVNEEEGNLKVDIVDNPLDDSSVPEQLIEVVEKEIIPQEDIFKDVKPVVKKPKRTRKMNPQALESLAKARAKANETRKRNKELRMKGEMPTPTQKKKIEEEIEIEKKRPVVNNITHKTENITNTITHDDIEAIVQKSTKKTLEEYDLTRKARKDKKKKDNEEATQKQQVRNTILKAQGYKYGQDNFYGGCF